jgi:hypothetical protein
LVTAAYVRDERFLQPARPRPLAHFTNVGWTKSHPVASGAAWARRPANSGSPSAVVRAAGSA